MASNNQEPPDGPGVCPSVSMKYADLMHEIWRFAYHKEMSQDEFNRVRIDIINAARPIHAQTENGELVNKTWLGWKVGQLLWDHLFKGEFGSYNFIEPPERDLKPAQDTQPAQSQQHAQSQQSAKTPQPAKAKDAVHQATSQMANLSMANKPAAASALASSKYADAAKAPAGPPPPPDFAKTNIPNRGDNSPPILGWNNTAMGECPYYSVIVAVGVKPYVIGQNEDGVKAVDAIHSTFHHAYLRIGFPNEGKVWLWAEPRGNVKSGISRDCKQQLEALYEFLQVYESATRVRGVRGPFIDASFWTWYRGKGKDIMQKCPTTHSAASTTTTTTTTATKGTSAPTPRGPSAATAPASASARASTRAPPPVYEGPVITAPLIPSKFQNPDRGIPIPDAFQKEGMIEMLHASDPSTVLDGAGNPKLVSAQDVIQLNPGMGPFQAIPVATQINDVRNKVAHVSSPQSPSSPSPTNLKSEGKRQKWVTSKEEHEEQSANQIKEERAHRFIHDEVTKEYMLLDDYLALLKKRAVEEYLESVKQAEVNKSKSDNKKNLESKTQTESKDDVTVATAATASSEEASTGTQETSLSSPTGDSEPSSATIVKSDKRSRREEMRELDS